MQDFPSRRIRFITYSAGGGRDLLARLIAQGISGPLGQSVSVENLGGSDSIPAEFVAKAPPDGHTLLVLGPSLWIGSLFKKVLYDPVRDFSPITLAVVQPNVLVVHPSVSANSVEELIALAHARPGELNYASGLNGTSSHLSARLFEYMAGVDMVGIPYEVGSSTTSRNSAPTGVNDLIAGKVQMMIFSAASAMPHVRAGKLKALAVTSVEPSVLAPGLPTMAATLPGYDAVQPMGIYAPANTPAAVIERLNYEIVRFLKTAEVKKQLLDAGMEVVGSTPDELAARMESEIAMLRKVIDAAGISTGHR